MDNISQSTVLSSVSPALSGASAPSSYSTQDFRRLRLEQNRDLENIQARAVREVIAPVKGLKWILQRVAKNILKPERSMFVTFSGDSKATFIPDKWHRFRSCYKTPFSKEVDIIHSKSSKKAHISGVSTCLNVHSCPVCSSYIAARRCDEIRLGMKNHFDLHRNGSVLMMVLTNSHDREDDLKDSLDKRKEAKSIFDSDWFVKSTMKKYGIYGKINAFEITYSKLNGWHPHNHILLFCSEKITASEIDIIKDTLSPYYRKALQSVGLSGSDERALNIYGGEYASQYVTKLAEEISLSQSKLGNITGGIPHYTPFQLLDYIHMNEGKDDTSWAKTAFYEYAETMRGRKSLVWSRGLKGLLKVRELSDEEAGQPSELDLMVYVSISSGDWLKLSRAAIDYRPMILHSAEMGRDILIKYLISLGSSVIDRGEYNFIKKPPIVKIPRVVPPFKLEFDNELGKA